MRLKCPHHVRFTVKDLDAQERFANDFGLITEEKSDDQLVMRTRGGDVVSYIAVKGDKDGYLGIAFETENEADLEEAISEHGARKMEAGSIPGVEQAVMLNDPDGHQVIIVLGVTRRPAEEMYPEIVLNTPFKKERFGRNQFTRDLGPARLWRFGHMGLFVKSFAASSMWYQETLGLIGSDIYHIPGMPQAKIVGFFRLNRGDEYVDHHVLAFMQDETRTDCHHISFEVQDFEAQQRTHRFLQDQEYESIWGVGRHPHGSHIFDVWRSPDGARFETFSDTDLFREENGTNIHDISTIEMDIWSSEGPEKYFI
jgi:catechol 2,3-dioxygenase-like lactoylglutathione lyase family enzyme